MEFNIFISKLLFSRNQAKAFHWQTSSYAKHIALDTFQSDIIDAIDTLVEAYQGEYGIIKMFKNNESFEYGEDRIIPYFEELVKFINTNRNTVVDKNKNTNLENTIDEIVSIINILLYRLKNLK